MRHLVRFALLTAVVAALSSCRPREGEAPALRRPNVLLVTIETLRADHLGSYGYGRTTSPNFDRLARQGARFETVVAQAPFTLPSIASLMTGLTPPSHGVRNHPATLAPEVETIAERFREAGYRTVAMTRHTWLRNRSGLDQGFEEYDNNKFAAGLDARSLSLAAVDWLERREPDRPFFLWLHFLDPHLPYTPSYPYSVMFDDAHAEDPQVRHLSSMIRIDRDDYAPTPYADLAGGPYYDLVLPQYPDNEVLLDLAFWRRSRGSIFFGKTRYRGEEIAELRNLYDGAILYADDNLGRVLAALDELALTESTIVVATGDHGEAFGEHGLYFTHDFTLYDDTLRVPLAIRAPEVTTPGTVIPQQVRLMDLAPTLAELARLPPVEGWEARSLVPLLAGGTLPYLEAFAESAPYRPQFSEDDRVFFPGNRGKWRMVRTDRWKLIKIPHPEGDRYELYDLETDPGETNNLYAELPGEAGKLKPLLDAWLARDPAPNADATGEEGEELEGLDPAAREQLRTLGYVQ